MRRFTRVSAAAIAAAVAIGALAGCGSSGSNKGGGDDDTFSVFMPQEPGTDLATNSFTKELEEKFDLSFTFNAASWDAAGAAEQRQVSLASGDYPDAYMLVAWIDGFTRAEVSKYAKQGLLVPLDDLIEEHAPNIKKAMEAQPQWAASLRAPDGKIYGLSPWQEAFHTTYPSKLWLNSAWLEKLGLEQPKTTDELKTVLEAFKNEDPNGNGKADEVPLSGSSADLFVPYLMDAFLYTARQVPTAPTPMGIEDGKVQLQGMQDEWRDGLEYIHSLYAEGLIDPAAFTQNDAAFQALGNNADVNILGSAITMWPGVFVQLDSEDGRDADYDAVPPLTGPDGVQTATYNSPASPLTTFALTNKSSEDERIKAIEMMDYIFTPEGARRATFGVEGEGWRNAEEGEKPLDESLEPSFRDLAVDKEKNTKWGSFGSFYEPADYRNAQVFPDDIYTSAGLERRLFQATEPYAEVTPKDDPEVFPWYALWPDDETSSEFGDLQTNITSAVSQAEAQFITGERDITSDAEWDSYIADLEKLGSDRYVELWQAMYDNSELSK